MNRVGQVVLGAYFIGYWYYLLSSAYLAWPKVGFFGLGQFMIPQAFISLLWPVWLWVGFRPFMP